MHHFADDIFKLIFFDEIRILIQIPLKFVPKGLADKKTILAKIKIMAWLWTGTNPLSEPMMYWFTEAYMWNTQYNYAKISINGLAYRLKNTESK